MVPTPEREWLTELRMIVKVPCFEKTRIAGQGYPGNDYQSIGIRWDSARSAKRHPKYNYIIKGKHITSK